jgi:hypothetical protein
MFMLDRQEMTQGNLSGHGLHGIRGTRWRSISALRATAVVLCLFWEKVLQEQPYTSPWSGRRLDLGVADLPWWRAGEAGEVDYFGHRRRWGAMLLGQGRGQDWLVPVCQGGFRRIWSRKHRINL